MQRWIVAWCKWACPIELHFQTLRFEFHVILTCPKILFFWYFFQPFKHVKVILSLQALQELAAGKTRPRSPACHPDWRVVEHIRFSGSLSQSHHSRTQHPPGERAEAVQLCLAPFPASRLPAPKTHVLPQKGNPFQFSKPGVGALCWFTQMCPAFGTEPSAKQVLRPHKGREVAKGCRKDQASFVPFLRQTLHR